MGGAWEWVGGGCEALEPRQLLATVFAVTDNNLLLQFESQTPGVIARATPITGLGAGEVLATVDFKPGTGGGAGTLFGVASGNRTPIYTINPGTGAATRHAPGLPGAFPLTNAVGFDYDDLNNVFRYTDELSGTYRFDGDTGVYLRNDAGVVGLSDVAYRPTGGDAGLFQMVGVLHTTDQFAVINPVSGTIISQGPLGVDVDRWVGVDTLPGGATLLSARVGGLTRLGTIGADGHTFVDLGLIGDGSAVVRGLSVDPGAAAPVLDSSLPVLLDGLNEDDAGSAGTAVGMLLSSNGTGLVSDASPGALGGIAITGADTQYGAWQYTLDGSAWSALGTVGEGSALLLPTGGLARVRFVPSADFHGTITHALRLRAWDRTSGLPGERVDVGAGGGASAFSTGQVWAGLGVLPVRDAPKVARGGPSGGAYTITEHESVTPFAGFGIAYVDDAGQGLEVTVRLGVSKGSLTPESLAAGGFVSVEDGVYRFVGTAAAATTALAGLVFKPAANIARVGQTTLSVLTVTVDDGLGAGVQVLSPFIGSRSVRDEPTVAGAAAGPGEPIVQIGDTQTVAPMPLVEFGYVDNPEAVLTVEVTVPAGAGALTVESLAASGFVDVGGGVYRFSGATATATAAARLLVLKPAENTATPGSVTGVTLGVSVTDGLGPAVAGIGPTIAVLSINDSPAASGYSVLSRIRMGKTVKPFRRVVVADPDGGETITATIRLNKPLKGKFTSASLAASGFVRVGRGRFQFVGTAAGATAAVRRLKFGYNSALSRTQSHTVKFTLSVADAAGVAVSNNQTKVSLRV